MKNEKISILVLLIFLSSTIILTSCQNVTQPNTNLPNEVTFFANNQNVAHTNFKSEEEFQTFITSNSYSNYYGYGLRKGGVMLTDSVSMEATSSIDTSSGSPSSGSNDFSQTNNQVQSVDEGDLIKTDGEYIYTITGQTLFVIKAYPGKDAEVISKYHFDQSPSGLFINGDNLLVYGTVSDYSKISELDDELNTLKTFTFANVFDISDKTNIKLTSEKLFEGYFQDSRMYEDEVYIITNVGNNFAEPYPMPIYVDGGVVREIAPSKIFYYSMPYNYPEFAGIQSIDISTGEIIDQKIIALDNGMTIYMSENNIYLTSTQYLNEWKLQQDITKDILKDYLTSKDLILMDKIQNTDNEILNNYEKESKIYQVYMNAMSRLSQDKQQDIQKEIETAVDNELAKIEYRTYSLINKVSFDNGMLSLENTLKLPGRLNNQFSMDEYENTLRVATTIDSNWFRGKSTDSENHIYSVDENMIIQDSITGIAKTETIYSTRFMGNKLYLVTFRQVDPFFVFDLSNPTDLKELGQLKIPGFSKYLHPYDENTLIGIGRDATEEGRQQGLKISLFDVSNPAEPKEIAKYVSDNKYSSSTAEYEHKAFLFSKDKELLVIPVYSWDYDSSENYNGAFVFKINKEEITLRGLIDHNKELVNEYYYYGAGVERSLYIEDELYTKSANLLRINSLEDLNSIKDIALKEDYQGEIPVY